MPAPSSWRDCVWHAFRARCLTPLHRDVLLRLGEYARCGAIWPSHETLAERARCHVETVRRALNTGRELGLIDWAERRVRRGWRWLRATNVYRLLKPERPAQPSSGGRRATNPQATGGKTEKKEKGRCETNAVALPTMLEVPAAVVEAAQAALARRRQQVAQRWAAGLVSQAIA